MDPRRDEHQPGRRRSLLHEGLLQRGPLRRNGDKHVHEDEAPHQAIHRTLQLERPLSQGLDGRPAHLRGRAERPGRRQHLQRGAGRPVLGPHHHQRRHRHRRRGGRLHLPDHNRRPGRFDPRGHQLASGAHLRRVDRRDHRQSDGGWIIRCHLGRDRLDFHRIPHAHHHHSGVRPRHHLRRRHQHRGQRRQAERRGRQHRGTRSRSHYLLGHLGRRRTLFRLAK